MADIFARKRNIQEKLATVCTYIAYRCHYLSVINITAVHSIDCPHVILVVVYECVFVQFAGVLV